MMKKSATESYLEAMRQTQLSRPTKMVIAGAQSGAGVVVTQPIGFQPLDIASKILSEQTTLVAITDYFGPGIYLALVKNVVHDGKVVALELDIDYIQGAKNSTRLFPNVDRTKGANRLDSVNFDPIDGLWFSRNARRNQYHMSFIEQNGGGWTLDDELELPGEQNTDNWVLCRRFTSDQIVTLEGMRSDEKLSLIRYPFDPKTRKFTAKAETVASVPIDKVHGFTIGGPYNNYYFLTRGHSQDTKGIYVIDKHEGSQPHRLLMRRNIWGSGLCFLAGGSFLLARYGLHPDSVTPVGQPGALVWIHGKD